MKREEDGGRRQERQNKRRADGRVIMSLLSRGAAQAVLLLSSPWQPGPSSCATRPHAFDVHLNQAPNRIFPFRSSPFHPCLPASSLLQIPRSLSSMNNNDSHDLEILLAILILDRSARYLFRASRAKGTSLFEYGPKEWIRIPPRWLLWQLGPVRLMGGTTLPPVAAQRLRLPSISHLPQPCGLVRIGLLRILLTYYAAYHCARFSVRYSYWTSVDTVLSAFIACEVCGAVSFTLIRVPTSYRL